MSDTFSRSQSLSFPLYSCPAHMLALAEADAICEKWDAKKMAKRDEKEETQLWNNRVFTAPMLLEDPEVFHGTRGHLVFCRCGGRGWLAR